jgi:Acetyltransferase (GNAT) domain
LRIFASPNLMATFEIHIHSSAIPSLNADSSRALFTFHQPAFLNTLAGDSRYFIAYEDGRQVLFFHCHLGTDQAISPGRGPFGGFDSWAEVCPSLFRSFVFFVLENLRAEGISALQIVLPPVCYQAQQLAWIAILQETFLGQIVESNLNQYLWTNDGGLCLRDSTQRRLQKCILQGCIFEEWPNPDLTFFYDFIVAARQRKKLPMNIPRADFEQMFAIFPEKYPVFIVRKESVILAACVGVVVRSDSSGSDPNILYYFLPADHPDYQQWSPSVMLLWGLYEYAQEMGFDLLDLGISTANGLPNWGLINFKKNLGALSCPKYKMQLQIR